jgi:hypothetical protein
VSNFEQRHSGFDGILRMSNSGRPTFAAAHHRYKAEGLWRLQSLGEIRPAAHHKMMLEIWK